jgi:saccharopine dehydrogenase (NADP+, L-glutamate forming)
VHQPGDGLNFAGWSAPLLPFIDADNKTPMKFLGLFDSSPVPDTARTSADILQHLVETRLAMRPDDKDMIVMLHEIEYSLPASDAARPLPSAPPSGAAAIHSVSTRHSVKSSLLVKGQDSLRTAMATTVGLPLGIAAKLILEGQIRLKGLHIPILPEIYEPVLAELAGQGVRFKESAE